MQVDTNVDEADHSDSVHLFRSCWRLLRILPRAEGRHAEPD